MLIDPTEHIATHRQELLRQAEQERLAAQVPHEPSAVRHDLARAVLKVADWIDDQPTNRYLPPSDSGPADWVTRSASV